MLFICERVFKKRKIVSAIYKTAETFEFNLFIFKVPFFKVTVSFRDLKVVRFSHKKSNNRFIIKNSTLNFIV